MLPFNRFNFHSISRYGLLIICVFFLVVPLEYDAPTQSISSINSAHSLISFHFYLPSLRLCMDVCSFQTCSTVQQQQQNDSIIHHKQRNEIHYVHYIAGK